MLIVHNPTNCIKHLDCETKMILVSPKTYVVPMHRPPPGHSVLH